MRNLTGASWRSLAGLLSALALMACSPSSNIPDPTPRPSDPYPIGPGCNAQPDPHCDNDVNREMVPLLRGSNIPIVDERSSELCRRMALDLIGRLPTPDEFEQCAHETPGAMADRFMSSRDYVHQQRRNWGERFYDLDDMWYPYVVEIDDLVRQLFNEQLSYQDFIARLVVHPGFYARFQGDDWAANVVRYALGRNARADEIAGMRPLQRIWDSRRFCDGVIWFNGIDDGETDDNANGSCGRTEWAVNYCNCRDGDGQSTCHSNVFGANVDFGADGCVNTDGDHRGDDVNLLRASDAAAGRLAVCPSGLPRFECGDRTIGDDGPAGALGRLGSITNHQRDLLYDLGRALAARPDFWEAAADRELRRFLSWWQNGLRRPDYDLPQVRAVLADQLRRTGSLRQLQRTIVTSLLYTLPSELPAGSAQPAAGAPPMPVWAFGPTRVLTGERWLDSVEMLTWGQVTGVCDFRFVATNYNWRRMVDRRLIEGPPSTGTYTKNYRSWAQSLGGCSASQFRTTQSTLSIVSAQNYLARKLCSTAVAYRPTDFDVNAADDPAGPELERSLVYMYQRFLGRVPAADELAAAEEDLRVCLAANGHGGCANGGTVLGWYCERLIDSAEFAIY